MTRIIAFKDRKCEIIDDPGKIPELLKSSAAVLWVDLEGGGENEIGVLRTIFQFHALAIEDCMHDSFHPKLDNFGDYIFLETQAIEKCAQSPEISAAEVSIFLGTNYLVSFHNKPVKSLESVWDKCLNPPWQIMEKGPDFLLYTVLDRIVDDYLCALEGLDDKIEEVEEEIFKELKEDQMGRILGLKKELLYMRRIIGPQRDILNFLSREPVPAINKKSQIYYRDVYDHLFRIYELLETYRDLVSGSLEIYLSTASNRMAAASNKMNEVIKTLTIVATVMMPLTVIVGLYGMNFKYMPELEWKYGYFFALGIMAFVAIITLWFIKKKHWL
ncbi:magnesium and cobalt transport protein CorA [Candidatus Desantisbacteria bacterium CG_4_10_14_0_8_um_filter_48_22]|uniref:Magnesium transport protein CorA n=1 Tax=Candidatus Desantisbacteria bacterium CG_4_10_14_0_8_um_filter_48_22 TaxID=1974543 RepID=A0A2M7S5Q5_9BACT|nr:MAG: magnesium and cobalt transport protein CorA [Candidatus Desantisbacteria bacterium CG1_02_49_89]PIV54216.1 MAG: magnesium and cobalt transport protein CorA [Candidatus Desantisbacteria bacterium CG02_land_8_20_14_3_00_49_13]PIZ14887.1 MAG: magnesium and cobalt transport protein CorA [Candidatus Desantisbacteria bacterium CG_4_10_14_0_8_um_filter_48_22]